MSNPNIPLSNGDQRILDALCCIASRLEAIIPLAGGSCDDPIHTTSCDMPIVGIENSTFEACFGPSGAPMRVEIIRSEDGTFDRYVGHLLDGSGPVDPLSASDITTCPKDPEYIDIPLCLP